MMKMGFKVGSGLGKDGEGRKEPVPINEVKTDKKGIGKAMKEKSDKEIIKNNIMKRQKMKVVNEKKLQSDFKSAQRERAVDNQIYKYVCQAQKALYDLDSQNDITQPDNPLYWPKGAVKDLSQDDPKEKEDFEELELLKQNPLISNQIIHKRVPDFNEDDNYVQKNLESDEEEINYSILLEEITGILRRRYFYCVYCGFSYNDENDLEENCPGNSYQLHD